ncbi:MAG TPA: HemK2/MTQ2 family protein methyltransferase [Nitrosopumilaceae archaeon]|nr:HemK2/MTQ2 family protein methyltransferase [Nitrosopumilaceae archaeon]
MQNKLSNDTYSPAEDTFFLEDHIKNEKGECALDIGSGSGYLTKSLLKSFSFVVGTDVNFDALQNQSNKPENLVCCNGADALQSKFDLIICNMPYLASEEISDIATDGGKEGIVIPMKIIKSAKTCLKQGGKFLFVSSSLSNYEKLAELTRKEGFEVAIKAKKKLFFEELILVEAISL